MSKLKESIILNAILPVADSAFHTDISFWYKKINKMLLWAPDEIKRWQTEKLKKLINHAYYNTIYYNELFDSLKIKPADINTIDDLEIIPPLTKEIIREKFDRIIPKNIGSFHYNKNATGGSTGSPLKYLSDNQSWSFDNAFNIIAWKRTGYHYGDKFVALGSSSLLPSNRKSLIHEYYYKLKGKIALNAMNLSEEILDKYVDIISKQQIHYVYGYASSIFILAKYIEDHQRETKVKIKACFPTSEILTETYRKTIERVFRCTVLDCYGANDGGIVAHDMGNGFCVGYNSIVQIDKENSVSFGRELLTDITNYAFPFIRYQLGDEVELSDDSYHDYNGQILKKVIGRTSDIIRLENDRALTYPGFTVLFKDLNVIGYRIFKSGPMEITIEIVKNSDYSLDEENLIRATMHKHAGSECNVIIKYVENMEKRSNGKNLFFMN